MDRIDMDIWNVFIWEFGFSVVIIIGQLFKYINNINIH